MQTNPINIRNLSIRSGVVWQADMGFLLACDTKREDEDPHAMIYRWHRGSFADTWAKFNAHSICRITTPELAIVFLSAEGFYGVHSSKSTVGNIIHDSQPRPSEPRYGSFRSVAEIGGQAYAVGLRGMAYRLDEPARWTRIDEGLPRDFDLQAIHGFDATDIYAVGFRGELWHFDSRQWTRLELPTNVNLTSVKCAQDETVYLGGHHGLLIRGRGDIWSVINHEETAADVWDLEWYKGDLYVSTFSGVYRLAGDALTLVDFGNDLPKTTYRLSAEDGVMWSIGERDVMAFDGIHWARIL